MISTWHSKGHALSSVGLKKSHTSIRTRERRSSRFVIRTDITLRSVRSLGAKMRTIGNADCSRSSHELAGHRDGPTWRPPTLALTEHKEYRSMKPKNTICLWFDKDALEAARFYVATFPD